MWRCSVPGVTKKKSKNRAAGISIEIDVNVDSAYFEKMMKEKVIPAIVAKMSWAKHVTIQMDNAKPHAGCGNLTKLNEYGATLTPKVVFILQPANSPDTNINDLCFFNSLASAVSKKTTRTKDELAKVVVDIYEKWHTVDRLDKLWRLKTAVMHCICANDGNNQFKMPHRIDKHTPARAPTNRPR